MTLERLAQSLQERAPGAWEIYRKQGMSREISRVGPESCESSRQEEGLAARWWDPAPRFAAAGSAEDLLRILDEAGESPAAPGPAPEWLDATTPAAPDPPPPEPPRELFEELSRLVSAESRGDASLTELTVRRGASREQVRNARGLDVSWCTAVQTGFAGAVGRRAGHACEARAAFRWEAEPDLASLALSLSDRATLPLSDRATPVDRGEWLLGASVGAALLAGLAPLFSGDAHPPWAGRAPILPEEISIVDDATADAPFDGEGTRSRRVVLVDRGSLHGRLHDLVSARLSGAAPTGHGVRRSYRTPPARAARRLFFETSRPAGSRELLASVRRGLFASALTAPLVCDLENDRYEAQFTGIAVVAGRAEGPVAAARARGRLSELLRRIAALSPDPTFFPMPELAGGSTLLIERASFD